MYSTQAHEYFFMYSLSFFLSVYNNYMWKNSTYKYFWLFFRVNFVSFNFTLFTMFNERDIEEYNKVNSIVHFNILLKSDRHSGIFAHVQMNTKLKRFDRDDFRTTATIVDVTVFLLLILSSGTYLYSICLTVKLCKVVHSLTCVYTAHMYNAPHKNKPSCEK